MKITKHELKKLIREELAKQTQGTSLKEARSKMKYVSCDPDRDEEHARCVTLGAAALKLKGGYDKAVGSYRCRKVFNPDRTPPYDPPRCLKKGRIRSYDYVLVPEWASDEALKAGEIARAEPLDQTPKTAMERCAEANMASTGFKDPASAYGQASQECSQERGLLGDKAFKERYGGVSE